MCRKAQVVLNIDEDVIGSFVNKFFGGDRKKGIGVLSLLVEDYIKDFVLGKKDIKIMVLDKGGGEQYFEKK